MTLSLDSPEWNSLVDAYGSAKHVPDGLRALERQEAEALAELYGRICHQHSVYSSSIAALPHLVRIAEKTEDNKFRAEILALAGAICESMDFPRELSSSQEPEGIRQVIAEALILAEALLPKIEDMNTASYLLQSAAAFAGFVEVARVMEGFVNEEFYLECPACGTDLYIWPTDTGLTAMTEDPVSHPDTPRVVVASGPTPDSIHSHAYTWLKDRAAVSPYLAGVRLWLPSLFGIATCPKCSISFPLMDKLVEEVG